MPHNIHLNVYLFDIVGLSTYWKIITKFDLKKKQNTFPPNDEFPVVSERLIFLFFSIPK